MPPRGLVVNRIQRVSAHSFTAARARAAAEQLEEHGRDDSSAAVMLHAQLMDIAARQKNLVRRFAAGHTGIPVAEVGALAEDVHDLDGLRAIGAALAGRT